MPNRNDVLYRGIVKEVMENACMVEFEDGTYQKAVIMFPYYSVEKRFTEETFGHGIVFKPAIWSPCVCAYIGGDLYVVGFIPPMNTNKLVTQEVVSGTEDLDQEVKGASGLIKEIKNNNKINEEQSTGHPDDYEYNDVEKTHGDMGFVAADGNMIMAYAFGLNVVMASNFCFRLYSKLDHTVREGFKNFYRYSPNVTESILNDQENGSRVTRRIKSNFKDEKSFITEIVGAISDNLTGYMRRFDSHPDEDEGSRVEIIDLGANYTCTHKAGGKIYTESIGKDQNGRRVDAQEHQINTDIENTISSKSKTNVISKSIVILDGNSIASIQGGSKVEIGSKSIVHINPPQMEPSPDAPANGNQAQTAGEMKPDDVIGKASDYSPSTNETPKNIRANKVKEMQNASADVYGPKIAEKAGGVAPDPTKVETEAIKKVSEKVEEAAGNMPEDMKSKIVDGVKKHILKISSVSGQFSNLTSNYIPKASKDVINDQSADEVLAAVASSAASTFDREDIEFKSGTVEEMMENDAGPKAKETIKNSTTDKVDPSDPSSPSVMEDKIASNIVSDTIKKYITPERIDQGAAVFGSRGIL